MYQLDQARAQPPSISKKRELVSIVKPNSRSRAENNAKEVKNSLHGDDVHVLPASCVVVRALIPEEYRLNGADYRYNYT